MYPPPPPHTSGHVVRAQGASLIPPPPPSHTSGYVVRAQGASLIPPPPHTHTHIWLCSHRTRSLTAPQAAVHRSVSAVHPSAPCSPVTVQVSGGCTQVGFCTTPICPMFTCDSARCQTAVHRWASALHPSAPCSPVTVQVSDGWLYTGGASALHPSAPCSPVTVQVSDGCTQVGFCTTPICPMFTCDSCHSNDFFLTTTDSSENCRSYCTIRTSVSGLSGRLVCCQT